MRKRLRPGGYLTVCLCVCIAPLLLGARRMGCAGVRRFEVDLREPTSLIGSRIVTHEINIGGPPFTRSLTARLMTPDLPLSPTRPPGASIASLRWRGDSFSRVLVFPRLGAPPLTGTLPIAERGWTLPEDDGTMTLDVTGRWAALRSVDMGGCSQGTPYLAGGDGIAEKIDAGIYDTLRSSASAGVWEACGASCSLVGPEPLSYGICMASCLPAGGRVSRGAPTTFWPEFQVNSLEAPPATETTGAPSEDQLCFSIDMTVGVGFCESRLRASTCFRLSVTTEFVPFTYRAFSRSPDPPAEFLESTIHVTLVPDRLLIRAESGQGICPTVTEDAARDAFTNPENGFARAIEDELTEAMWATNPLCRSVARLRDFATCQDISGTNNIRVNREGEIQFRAEPDRFEVFPDRLETVLTRHHWDIADEPRGNSPADRQVGVFDLAGLCDDDRSWPATTDHPWGVLVVP